MQTQENSYRGYGKFGPLVKAYTAGRTDFPSEVFELLWQEIKTAYPTIVDMGCGTGIASRQLSSHGAQVIGVDIDPDMLSFTGSRDSESVVYMKASVKNLPFVNEQFDAVTAFSAFHWFCDQASIKEIRRVLKKNGVLFVVNKNDIGDLKKECKAILKRHIGTQLPNIKNDYDPKVILEKNSFERVEKHVFTVEEDLSVSSAIAYLQSISIWNLVPSNALAEAHRDISDLCQKYAVNGVVKRKVEVTAVLGRVKRIELLH